MARCFGTSEEQAFINGTGANQPTGILHATDGGETSVTAESDFVISYDEIIRLYFSVDKKYRKHGTSRMSRQMQKAMSILENCILPHIRKSSGWCKWAGEKKILFTTICV